jgi:hypothetical protein
MIDDGIPGIDDWDLWIRIAEMFPVIAIETPVMIWRQSSATSAQGSSDTVKLIESGRKRFREYWMRLPRVAGAAAEKRKIAWQEFSKNITEHLAWESFNGFRNAEILRASSSLWTLLQLHPGGVFHVLYRWTTASTVATLVRSIRQREDLSAARAHFKHIRSNPARR